MENQGELWHEFSFRDLESDSEDDQFRITDEKPIDTKIIEELEKALLELEDYNKTAARVIKNQLKILEDYHLDMFNNNIINNIRHTVSIVVEQILDQCFSDNESKAASCNSIANLIEESIRLGNYKNGIQDQSLMWLKSTLEGITEALKTASRTNTRKAANRNNKLQQSDNL